MLDFHCPSSRRPGDQSTRLPTTAGTDVPACPSLDEPVDLAALQALGPTGSLTCFGNHELSMIGWVECWRAAVDARVAGPSWLSTSSICELNGILALNGFPVSALIAGPTDHWLARYHVRGHFDDPESAACGWIPFGVTVDRPVGTPNPEAVSLCRQLFVVTDLTKLD